jgi:hypothetical protein
MRAVVNRGGRPTLTSKDRPMRSHRMQPGVFSSAVAILARFGLAVAVTVSAGCYCTALSESLQDTSIDPSHSCHRFTLGQRPFAASSSWNTPVPLNVTYKKVGWPLTARFGVAWSSYSPAVYVALDSHPIVSVEYPPGWGYPGGILNIRMSGDVDGAAGTDGELLVIDGDTVHNFWQFKRRSLTEAAARSYGATNILTGSGWGRALPFLGAGIVGAGASQLAGLLLQAETDRGEIAHALQISIESSLAKPGHAGEAISGDGKNPDGLVQEGQRLAIPPDVPMPRGLSPLGQRVFRAYQKYGAFVIDVAGGVTNLRAQANAYDRATIIALQRDVARISPLLERVEHADE